MAKTRNRAFFRVAECASLAFSTFVYLATIVINALAGQPTAAFEASVGNISDQYFLDITPGSWAFSIWGFIYTWQGLWHIYGWSFVCRPKATRTISLVTYWLFGVGNLGNITWIFLWGNYQIVAALPFIMVIPICLIVSLSFTAWRTYKATSALQKNQRTKTDLWATRILVHNGIAFYATWVSIAWLLNVAIVGHYFGQLSLTDAGTLSLSLLLVEILVWFFLDIVLLDRFTRYIQSVYIVIFVATTAVVTEHWNRAEEDPRNHRFALALVLLVVLLQTAKIVLTIVFAFVRKIKFPVTKRVSEAPLSSTNPNASSGDTD